MKSIICDNISKATIYVGDKEKTSICFVAIVIGTMMNGTASIELCNCDSSSNQVDMMVNKSIIIIYHSLQRRSVD
jgi:hypothetical protein